MAHMFEMQRVNVDLVKLDDTDSNVRASMNEEAIADYQELWEQARANKSGNPFAQCEHPIKLFFDGEGYWVGDGRHRLEGARRAGISFINLLVTPGTKQDAIMFATSCVSHPHGVRYTRKDKHRAVRKTFNINPDLSIKAVAQHCGVTEVFVRKIKDAMTGTSTAEERVKAKVRKVMPPEPPKKKPTKEQTAKVTTAYAEELKKKLESADVTAKNIKRWFATLAKLIDDYNEFFDEDDDKHQHDTIIGHLTHALDAFIKWQKNTTK